LEFFFNSMRSPGLNSRVWNGPGANRHIGDRIELVFRYDAGVSIAENFSKSRYGIFRLKTTVYLSGASIEDTMSKFTRAVDPVARSMTRAMVALASSESNSRPSWNFTPLRSLNVHVF